MKKLLTLFSIAIAIHTAAQTMVSSNLTSNTNWTLSGSPYIVTIDLVVFQGVTLTIDPGVEVRFDDDKELDLRGRLSAIGTPTDSILFTSSSANPTIGIWGGIRISGLGSPAVPNQVRMSYCIGEYADRFVDMDLAYEGPYIYTHCTFAHNTLVSYDGGQGGTYFSDCDFLENITCLSYNQFGGRVQRSRFLKNHNGVDGFSNVDSCLFRSNTGIACSPYGAAGGNTIENNFIGVRCYYNAVNDSFIGNTVQFNTIGVEIQSFFNGYQQFHHNIICNNSQYDIKMATPNNANLGNNCWCTKSIPDPQKIYDGYDDPAQGLVTTTPVITNCGDSWVTVEPSPDAPLPFTIGTQSSGIFSVTTTLDNAVCEVYAANGQLVRRETLLTNQQLLINLQTESTGIYVIRILTTDQQWTQKVMVE